MASSSSEPATADGYSIRVAARLTGISADQLRVWERRYGYPKPERNNAGNRIYSDEQIHRLSLIGRALNAGYRARDAISTPPEDLRRFLVHLSQDAPPAAPDASAEVERVVELLRNDDLPQLRAELKRLAAERGPRSFVTEIAGALTKRVGNGWANGELEVRHEHLLTEALSTQLSVVLARLEDGGPGPSVVLATFPNEQHGLGLQMAALYLASTGAKPHLLGVNTPAEQVLRTATALRADAVGISVSQSSDTEEARYYLGQLLARLPKSARVWVGGEHDGEIGMTDPRVARVRSWEDLDAELAQLSAS